MKKVGQTNKGNILVEMTVAEYKQFDRLSQAIEGVSWPQMMNRDYGMLNVDFSGTFGAILAFTQAKFMVNEMRALLDDFEAHLGKGKE